jgi:hypothetical protein
VFIHLHRSARAGPRVWRHGPVCACSRGALCERYNVLARSSSRRQRRAMSSVTTGRHGAYCRSFTGVPRGRATAFHAATYTPSRDDP